MVILKFYFLYFNLLILSFNLVVFLYVCLYCFHTKTIRSISKILSLLESCIFTDQHRLYYIFKKIEIPNKNANVTQGVKKLILKILSSRALRKLLMIEQNNILQYYRTASISIKNVRDTTYSTIVVIPI